MSREGADTQYGPIDPKTSAVSRVSECFRCMLQVTHAYPDPLVDEICREIFLVTVPSFSKFDKLIKEAVSDTPLVLAYFLIPCGHRFNQIHAKCPTCKTDSKEAVADHDFREMVRILHSREISSLISSPEVKTAQKEVTHTFEFTSFFNKVRQSASFTIKSNTITRLINAPVAPAFSYDGKAAEIIFIEWIKNEAFLRGKNVKLPQITLNISIKDKIVTIVIGNRPVTFTFKNYKEHRIHILSLHSLLNPSKSAYLREGQILRISDCSGHAVNFKFFGHYKIDWIGRQAVITAGKGGLRITT